MNSGRGGSWFPEVVLQRRNALRLALLCILLCPSVEARAAAESQLATRRCAPCAHSSPEQVWWETTTHMSPENEYHKLKLQYPDCILMFHTPGSYLFLHDDVATAGEIIGITCGSEVLRIPESWLDDVLPALCRAGHRVAVCEDVEPEMI
jgi:hypothetical protein